MYILSLDFFVEKDNKYVFKVKNLGSSPVDDKMFLESNASSIPGTYFRLG